MSAFWSSLLASVLLASIPLIVAGMGELLTEKSGVLNLGVEGMMLLGAVSAFAVALSTGSAWAGIIAGVVAGALAALLFAFLVLRLLTNQTATGLALTILGTGLSALVGIQYVGLSVPGFAPLSIPFLSQIPFIGEVFNQSVPAYLGIVWCIVFGIMLFRSKFGLKVRAVGESPSVAHAIGYDVIKVRYIMTILGGAMAGFAGAFVALVQFKAWQEGITGGVGWIAVALVVFATWHPARLIFGALLFGLMRSLGFAIQAANQPIQDWLAHQSGLVQTIAAFLTNVQVLNALPYVATVVVLCWISRDWRKVRMNAPMSLSQPFLP